VSGKIMTNHDKPKQRDKWFYSLLSKPRLYEALQRLLGAGDACWRRYVDEFVAPKPGVKILDIGCGPGTILKYLPGKLEYVGFDINPNYIAQAQATYGKRGNFFCQRVSDTIIEQKEYYDIVLASSVLHHLNDDEAMILFRIAYKALMPGGYLLTCDPVFIKGQHWLAKIFISMDRGLFVRTPDRYLFLANGLFSRVESRILHDMLWIPYTLFIMKCIKF
jgi:2-polyprenyl-3-methyl-5-hydroxy-6-metoxy-1,4-benzoquinol methylase